MRIRAAPEGRHRSGPEAARPREPVPDLRRAVGNLGVMRMLRAYARAVVPGSEVAERARANAVTADGVVHLAPHVSALPAAERRRILAHEAVHAAQQAGSGPAAARSDLESEADVLARDVLAGSDVHPIHTAAPGMALRDDRVPSPQDRVDVERAKRRREVLLRFKAVLEGGDAQLTGERSDLAARRQRLDRTMTETLDLLSWIGPGKTVADYQQEEQKKLAGLNRAPVSIVLTPDAVKLVVRFQVRYEGLTDAAARTRFPVLDRNLRKGIEDTWNQRLPARVLGGRAFELVPEVQLVSATAARDHGYWLITVRPTNQGPLAYGSTSLGVAPNNMPTSATDPLVDGGVMSIPPSHESKPDVLGHETLHLFGMVDRYALIPAQFSKSGKPGEQPLRETGRRRDPLGASGGKILEEDIGFVLEATGVYDRVAAAATNQTSGMSYPQVLAELKRVEEIIQLGRDPHSLIPERKDFRREVMKSAEDLD
jgi:hypothetical protein